MPYCGGSRQHFSVFLQLMCWLNFWKFVFIFAAHWAFTTTFGYLRSTLRYLLTCFETFADFPYVLALMTPELLHLRAGRYHDSRNVSAGLFWLTNLFAASIVVSYIYCGSLNSRIIAFLLSPHDHSATYLVCGSHFHYLQNRAALHCSIEVAVAGGGATNVRLGRPAPDGASFPHRSAG